jgi:hypothetical protein
MHFADTGQGRVCEKPDYGSSDDDIADIDLSDDTGLPQYRYHPDAYSISRMLRNRVSFGQQQLPAPVCVWEELQYRPNPPPRPTIGMAWFMLFLI